MGYWGELNGCKSTPQVPPLILLATALMQGGEYTVLAARVMLQLLHSRALRQIT